MSQSCHHPVMAFWRRTNRTIAMENSTMMSKNLKNLDASVARPTTV